MDLKAENDESTLAGRALQRGPPSAESAELRLAGLMAAAQDGDATAYRALLRDCVPLIAASARLQGVMIDRIDDVVQEVLVIVHRVRATYSPGRPFLLWLGAIAQRRAIDSLHRDSHGGRKAYNPFARERRAEQGAQADEALHSGFRSEASLEMAPPG